MVGLSRIARAPKRAKVAIELPGAGAGLKAKTAPGPLQLTVASTVPAWVYSASGRRFQAALPEQAGLTVRAASSGTDELQMLVRSDHDDGRVFVPYELAGGKPGGRPSRQRADHIRRRRLGRPAGHPHRHPGGRSRHSPVRPVAGCRSRPAALGWTIARGTGYTEVMLGLSQLNRAEPAGARGKRVMLAMPRL